MIDEYPDTNDGVARRSGREAYKKGDTIQSNPHTRHSYNWLNWREGFLSELYRNMKRRRENVPGNLDG